MAAILLTATTARSLEDAALGDRQHRAYVDSRAYPWSSLGKLFNSVGGACTGAVIAEDKILTAAHCMYAARTNRFLPPDAIHVLLGYELGGYDAHARIAHYEIGPGHDPQDRKTEFSDWAVLTLAARVPAAIRPLSLLPMLPAVTTRLALAGFAQDRPYVLSADLNCHFIGKLVHEQGTLVTHDCVNGPGDSGAPLLALDATNGFRIVAVSVAMGRLNSGAETGLAVPDAGIVPKTPLPSP